MGQEIKKGPARTLVRLMVQRMDRRWGLGRAPKKVLVIPMVPAR